MDGEIILQRCQGYVVTVQHSRKARNDYMHQLVHIQNKCFPIIFLNYMQKRYLSLLNLNISETIVVNVAGELF